MVPGAGAGVLAARQPMREATHAAEVSACAAETARGAAAAGGGDNVRRTPEEKEKGIFHPEVSGRFPSSAFTDRPGPKIFVFMLAGRRPPCPLLRRPRC
jgi:hypothetical protein